ncbi:hypothetical protein [Chryseobacterium terrae]|uniref:C1q domain-containing protein n=1 Tax=Chryseobacterium terrae TaxID=3163299 RepID=A0ABW8Y562_9FLAO
MKNCYMVVALFIISCNINAQVGINTENPKSTLHVQKKVDLTYPDGIIPPRISGDSLRLKEAAYTTAQNGAIVYVTSPVTNPNPATDPKTQDVGSTGFFVYDAYYTHPTNVQGIWNKVLESDLGMSKSAYAAKFKGNLSLVNITLGLFTSSFNYLPLSTIGSTVTTEITSTQIINNEYVVPSTGIYHIDYSFRTGQGLSAQLLSNNPPGIAIVKTVGTGGTAVNTLLDYRVFGGVNLLDLSGILALNLVVVNVTLTQGQISHIYRLNAGDRLRFGLVQGGLNLGAISDKSAELSIYKIR